MRWRWPSHGAATTPPSGSALTAFAAMSRAGGLTRVGARHRAARVLGDALVAVESAADPTAG
ncbi:MAG TPA: hypothetical protein VN327_09975 [Pseudonocardiaceae bacterium]|nr:hypothetical protein [Pseudonocardiaceae bacterium]